MTLKGFCFSLTYWSLIMVTESQHCPWSSQTVRKVTSCPITKSDLERRKMIKDCEALKHQQNCTEPEKFLYHCVINELQNAYIEVCAPLYMINGGYCTEFNELGARIQAHSNFKCRDVGFHCAERYKSTDAYLYKDCYTVVKSVQSISNTSGVAFTTDLPSSVANTNTSKEPSHGLGIGPVIIIVIIGVVIICILIAVIIIMRKNKKRKRKKKKAAKDKKRKKKKAAKGGEAEEPLNQRIYSKEAEAEEHLGTSRDNADDYIKIYDDFFVVTELARESSKELEKNGMVVIIGQQGSGKTMIANHIQRDIKYKDWNKETITSVNDLKRLKPTAENNTLIFIDNIFDGFEYQKELYDWWKILFDFYDNFVKGKDNVRLIITAKDNVIEKAFLFINRDTRDLAKTFFLRAKLHPLTDKEQMDILHNQFQLAKKLQQIDRVFLEKHHTKLTRQSTCSIGFPLCAHLYAFEDRESTRDCSIVARPTCYVLNQIENEMEKDKSGRSKTLFLLLLFSGTDLDLTAKDKCFFKKFLKQRSSAHMLGDMKPLSFEDLDRKAQELEGRLLIKRNNLYEFKHQIYLEGVGTYFFRHYFDTFVEHVPFDILKPLELHDLSEAKLQKLIERLSKEIRSNRLFFKVLSCDMLQDSVVEQKFCDLLRKTRIEENLLTVTDGTSAFKLQIIFWANKYKLAKVSKLLMDFAEKDNKVNKKCQFYLAMFGQCCAVDEDYINDVTFPAQIMELQKLVFKFRTQENNTILHLLLSSDMTDYDAHCYLKQLLDEEESLLKADESLVDCALQQIKYSRLMCLLEIFKRLSDLSKSAEQGNRSIDELVKVSSSDPHFELERLCRICILVVKGGYNPSESMVQYLETNISADQKKMGFVEKMEESLEKCLSSLNYSSSANIMVSCEFDMKPAVDKFIQILSKREEPFKK